MYHHRQQMEIYKPQIKTNGDAYNAVLKRIAELQSEVDEFKNIIYVNRKHLSRAKKRLRVLCRGVELMEKGWYAKAIQLFEKENKSSV